MRPVICLLLATTLGSTLGGCAKHLPPTMSPDDTLTYTTDDGWTAQIRHYPGDGPPVLLVHGMGANHYNFDFREDVSLAAYLQQRGWDVWVPELRGDPGALAPSQHARRNYTFDDHAVHDLPAVVDAVLAKTGRSKLYWVGHSMGGMLLYTALVDYPDKIAAGVAIGSPSTLETEDGLHHRVRAMGWAVGRHGALPAASMARLASPLGRANPLFAELANGENMDWPTANGMARVALIDLPRPMAHQAVTWLRSGEVLKVDGTPWYPSAGQEPSAGQAADVPLLVMGGTVDKVVPQADVAHTCDVFPDCRYVLMGKAGGFSVDYGHVDPVVGKTAETEIYPLVAGFLDEHRE